MLRTEADATLTCYNSSNTYSFILGTTTNPSLWLTHSCQESSKKHKDQGAPCFLQWRPLKENVRGRRRMWLFWFRALLKLLGNNITGNKTQEFVMNRDLPYTWFHIFHRIHEKSSFQEPCKNGDPHDFGTITRKKNLLKMLAQPAGWWGREATSMKGAAKMVATPPTSYCWLAERAPPLSTNQRKGAGPHDGQPSWPISRGGRSLQKEHEHGAVHWEQPTIFLSWWYDLGRSLVMNVPWIPWWSECRDWGTEFFLPVTTGLWKCPGRQAVTARSCRF